MKTFYSVNYRKIGADQIYTKWFDNLEKANEFASRDFSGHVIIHNVKNENSIVEFESLVNDVWDWN